MLKAVSLNWTVRFPLNLFNKIKNQILNECISEAEIEPNRFARYEDRYFVVNASCDIERTLENFMVDLGLASDEQGIAVFHIPQGRMSSFAVDFEGDGKTEPRFD